MLKNLLSKKTENILNAAVQSELYASHLYKHLANQLQRLGYFGGQKHFAAEAADELEHYQRLADLMNDMGTVAQVPMLEACEEKVTGLRDAVQIAYETELQLGMDYQGWYKACDDSPMVQQALLFFLEQQRKSVGEYGALLARLNLAGDDKCGLLIIDQEMGA